MKKINYIILILTLIFLTGCEKTTLKCTRKKDNKEDTIILKFDKENTTIKNMDFDEKIVYNKLDAHIDLDYYDIKDTYTTFDNLKGITYEVNKNQNDIKIKLNIDFTLTDDDNIPLFTISKNMTKNDAKINLENQGYTCK